MARACAAHGGWAWAQRHEAQVPVKLRVGDQLPGSSILGAEVAQPGATSQSDRSHAHSQTDPRSRPDTCKSLSKGTFKSRLRDEPGPWILNLRESISRLGAPSWIRATVTGSLRRLLLTW